MIDNLGPLFSTSVFWFTFIGSVVEELVFFIPSPATLLVLGGLIYEQRMNFLELFFLCLVATVVKTLANTVIYYMADVGEDIFIERFGKRLRISKNKTEGIGNRLKNKKYIWLYLYLLRSFPLIPSTPLSAVCGFLKLPTKKFVTVSFLGAFTRSFIYIAVGYFAAFGFF